MATVLTECIVQQVADLLWLVDLFHLQATDTLIRQVCLKDKLWSMIVSRELPGLKLSPALAKQIGRRKAMHLLRELSRSQVSVSGAACAELTQGTEVQKLTRLLSTVNHSAQIALAHDGHPRIVFVGPMRFPTKTLTEWAQVQDMRNLPLAFHPPCIGDAFPLQRMAAPLGNLVPEPCGANFSRLPNGLMLYLALQGRYLLLQVRNDSQPPSDGMVAEPVAMHTPVLADNGSCPKIVSLDIKASSSTFMLDFRDVELVVNHPWKICRTGLLAIMGGRAATVEALSKGIPCVVCIRRGQANVQRSCGLTGSLNVDSIRR